METEMVGRRLLAEGRAVIAQPLPAVAAPAVQGQVLHVAQAPQAQVMAHLAPQTSACAAAHQLLAQLDRIQIRQQRQWLEALTGFEQNNRYVMRDSVGRELCFIQEGSNCIERNCFKGACKPWRMDLHLVGAAGVAGGIQSMTPFVHLERPCTLTCLHWNRPEVLISDLATGHRIGSVVEPFTCCNLKFEVRDSLGQSTLETDATCCQPGIFGCCPCEGTPCNTASFPVSDSVTGAQVAQITKQWMWGDVCPCLGEWGNVWLEFGTVANSDHKVLLIALALFIQMRFFDRRNRDK